MVFLKKQKTKSDVNAQIISDDTISDNNVVTQKPPKKPKHHSKFATKTMGVFSKLSKAFLLPIALLPIAGVFLGVGSAISANVVSQTGAWYFGQVLNKMGDVAFGNLPILFAISTALAFTKDSGVAAITAVVGFLVMNGIQAALLHTEFVGLPNIVGYFENGKMQYVRWKDVPEWTHDLLNYQYYFDLDLGDGSINLANAVRVNLSGERLDAAGRTFYSMLYMDGIPNGLVTSNIGVQSLNTGVLAAIFVGWLSAWTYNKFHKVQLPSAISFFSGTKLVPIIIFFLVIPLSFIFILIWPWVGLGLARFGQMSGTLPVGLDSFIFEIVERSLVPFGLHHVFYAPLWWTNAGGSISEAFNNAERIWSDNGSSFLASSINGRWDLAKFVYEYEKVFHVSLEGESNIYKFRNIIFIISSRGDLWTSMGDQTILYKVIANSDIINFTFLEHLGLNLGRFQSGKFGFMLIGLPLASIAMWLTVPKENRSSVMGIYLSAAFTCFLTGITEPIEYTFLFLAPWMFYGVHMPLASISFLLSGLLSTHVGMTVSGGFIDYIVFGIIPFATSGAMTWISVFGILFVAIGLGLIYFILFYFLVKYKKINVPGRNLSENEETKLYSKSDVQNQKNNNETNISKYTYSKDKKEIARYNKAVNLIKALGGIENISSVDSCASRLRVDVKNTSIVDKNFIMDLGGARGIIYQGNNVQIVYGGEQEAIKPRMNEIIRYENKHPGTFNSDIGTKKLLSGTVVSVSEDMIVKCPECGEEFKVKLSSKQTDGGKNNPQEPSHVHAKQPKPSASNDKIKSKPVEKTPIQKKSVSPQKKKILKSSDKLDAKPKKVSVISVKPKKKEKEKILTEKVEIKLAKSQMDIIVESVLKPKKQPNITINDKPLILDNNLKKESKIEIINKTNAVSHVNPKTVDTKLIQQKPSVTEKNSETKGIKPKIQINNINLKTEKIINKVKPKPINIKLDEIEEEINDFSNEEKLTYIEIESYVAGLEQKYKEQLAAKLDKQPLQFLTSIERAKIDGSLNVQESRQQLQKNATALRQEAERINVKLPNANLRELTKLEVIRYLSNSLIILSHALEVLKKKKI